MAGAHALTDEVDLVWGSGKSFFRSSRDASFAGMTPLTCFVAGIIAVMNRRDASADLL
jgi:hypothetical protein